jgi:hypothetical protein
MTVSAEVLSARALNRATLARQFLLRRERRPALDAIEALAGLQAQAPDAPYVALWSRLDGFSSGELAGLLTDRQVVRVPLMRATVHMVSARDCLMLRPAVQHVLARSFTAQTYARNLDGVDIDAVLAAAQDLLSQRPLGRQELGRLLAERWPGRDPQSLAYAVSYLLPVVHVPPRGVWRSRGPIALAPAESWLGRPFSDGASPGQLVLRYLAAFGPASVADMQLWSGLSHLQEVTSSLGLRTFRDEQGRELFDLADAPRPSPDIPAPPRFLPEYDNVLLSHRDRSRLIPDGRPVPLPPGNGGRCGTLLVDGLFRATWRITRQEGTAALHVEAAEPLPDQDAIAAEGTRLLAFAADDAADRRVLFAPATVGSRHHPLE